jgi:phage terminase large subunit-like protein
LTVEAPSMVLPRWYTPSKYGQTRGPLVTRFAESLLSVPKGPRVGQPLRYLNWQRWLLNEVLEVGDDNLLRYRRGLVGVARQNGKSIIGSGLGLEHLFSPTPGLEVYSCAGDRQQARIVFGEARRQVLASETLSKLAKVYRDVIEVYATGNIYRILSADAKLAQGLSPSLVIFDEVHVQPNHDLWDAMTMGTGAREQPLVLGITTAGDDPESLCGQLYEYGVQVASGELDDERFGMWWWEPSAGEKAEIDDRSAWRQANPSLVEGVTYEEDMEMAARQSQPIAFRRYRLNQWFRHGGAGWMDMAAWDLATDEERDVGDGDEVLLTFDGSVDEDATAIGLVTLGENPHFDLLAVWEPDESDENWQVPRDEVAAVIDAAFQRYKVYRLLADPAYWRTELQLWADKYGARKVLEWPVSNARMGPAVAEAYKRIKDRTITVARNPTLRRHVANAVVKDLASGLYTIKKEKKGSSKKIDAAVTFVIAIDGLERFNKTRSRVLHSF